MNNVRFEVDDGDHVHLWEFVLELAKGVGDALEIVQEERSRVAFDDAFRAASSPEGRKLAGVAPNVVVKVPLTRAGLTATGVFSREGIQTNVTLCFSAAQALMAAKAGATYISPFIGRIDDMGVDGMELISEIRTIYDNYGFETEILAASIRTLNHVREAALIGADVATVPPATLKALVKHPLTDKGLELFMADWAKTGQTIV